VFFIKIENIFKQKKMGRMMRGGGEFLNWNCW